MDRLTFVNELTGDKYVFINDFMQHVLYKGEYVSRLTLFPNSKIDWNSGYLIKEDGHIVCAIEANNHIAQFDGCHHLNITI